MCHVCGKSFIFHEGYSAHMKVHQSDPSAWCNICGAAFKFLSSLKAHQKMHSNKKDFKCEICGRDFLRKRTLTDHMKVHEKGTSRKALISTPVEFCTLCSKGFSDNYGLQRHMRKHRLGLLKRFNRIQTKTVALSQYVGPISDHCRSKSVKVVAQSDGGPRYQSIDPECFVDTVSVNDCSDDDANVSCDENVEEALNDIKSHKEGTVESTSSNLNKSHDKDSSEDHFIDYNKEIPIDKLKEMYAADDVTEEVAVINSLTSSTEYIVENSSTNKETDTHLTNVSPNELVEPIINISQNNGVLEAVRYENRIVQIRNPNDIYQSSASTGIFDSIQSTTLYCDSFLVANTGTVNGFHNSLGKNDKDFTCTTETINVSIPSNELTADVINVITQPISVEIQQTVPVCKSSDTSVNTNQYLHNDFSGQDQTSKLFSSRFSHQEKIDNHFEMKEDSLDSDKITGSMHVDEENVEQSAACSVDLTVSTLDNKNISGYQNKEEVNQSAVNTEGESRMIECRKCPKTFSDQLSYKSHLVDHEEQQFECQYCMSKYANHKSLKMHLYRYHPKGENNIYKCASCSKMFASKLIYLNHVDNHRWKGKKLEKEKACDICGAMFKSYLSFLRHMRVKHSIYEELIKDNQDNEAKAENPRRRELVESNTNDVNHLDESDDDGNTEEINKTTDFDGNEARNTSEFNATFNAANKEGGMGELNIEENENLERNHKSNSIVSSDQGEAESEANVPRNNAGNKSQNKKASTKFRRKYKCTKCDKSFYMKASRKQHMLTHSKCNEGLGGINARMDTLVDHSVEPDINPIESKLSNVATDDKVDHESGTSKLVLNRHTNISVVIEDVKEETGVLNDEISEDHSNVTDKNTFTGHHTNEQIGFTSGVMNKNLNTGANSEKINRGSPNVENQKCKNEKLSALFKCLQCKKQFSTHREKVQHVKTVCDANQFLCENCPKKFSTMNNLKRHIAINHSNKDGEVTKNFMCIECGKRFTASDSLRIHMFSHTGERPYKCEQCDASYVQSGHLKRHVRTAHTRQSIYECQHPGCQKKFFDPSSLTIHMKIHSEVRKYQCTICPKVFKTSVVLKKHIKTHQDTKDFECHICSQMLSTNFCLQKHLKRHASSEKMDPCSANYDPNFSAKVKQRFVKKMEEKKFQCEFCMSKFTTTRALLAHQRKFCKGKPGYTDNLTVTMIS